MSFCDINGDSSSPGATLELKKQLLLIPSDDIDIGGDPPFTYTYTSALPFCSKHRLGVAVNE